MESIPPRMKALVAHGPGDYRLQEVDTPRAGPDDLIVRVEACGICASDLKCHHGADRFWGGGGPGKDGYVVPPFVPGHEFIGRVAEAGQNMAGAFALGDRVTSEQIVPCWDCRYCRTGHYWMCRANDVYGFKKHLPGAMAEYVRLPKGSRNYRVSPDLPIASAVLVEPYACAKHAVDRARVTPDDVVVLAGCGCLGLGMAAYLRLLNPRCLVALDRQDDRLRLAAEFGADVTMNPSRDDVVAKILDMTEGYGCDVYIEATGHPDAVRQGLDAIRKLGRFVEFSVFGAPASIDWSIIGDMKELDVLGAHLGPYCYETVIRLIESGRLPTQGVVTHQFGLDRWEEAFTAANDAARATRVVIG